MEIDHDHTDYSGSYHSEMQCFINVHNTIFFISYVFFFCKDDFYNAVMGSQADIIDKISILQQLIHSDQCLN